jgi:ATP-dependent Clp protease ATP-binding subunit ClpC
MPDNKDIEYWHKILEQYRANLRKQRKQQATFAKGDERLALLNQIESSEEEIREAKAKLRELGVEPETSTIDPPEEFELFNELFIKAYPFPIAQACADFNREPELGRRFVILDKLITHLIKYLAAILIGQAQSDKTNEYPLPKKLNWIATPTMEDWTEAICKLSQLYNKSPHREACKIPDLIQASCRPLLGRQELVDAIDFLSIQLVKPGIDEPTVVDFLQLLAWFREKEWQEAASQYSLEKIKPLMLRLQPAMAVLLNELESIRRYLLIYLERSDAMGTDIHLRTVKFMGLFTEDLQPFNKPALILPQEEVKHLKRHRLYLADTGGNPQLNLHPFFILYRWELYVIERHESSNFVEFRSCSGGKRLRPPPEARTFYASWWEEQTHGEGEPAEEVPPVLGEEENWTDSVEEIPSDDPMESFPLTWLSAEGRQTMEIALGEALRLGRFWLGIEFLLMGMTKQEGCTLSELFREMGISRSQFRGVIRGIVGQTTKNDWRSKNVFELGAQALPNIQPANPSTLAVNYNAEKEQTPVFTPRMMEILKYALKLANEKQIGHGHLLLAALKHYQSPVARFLFGIAAEAGWDPKKVHNWIIQHAGIAGKTPYEAPDQDIGLRHPYSPPSPMSPVKGVLGKYGRDLNEEARAKKIHAAIGVDDLLRRMKRILIQRETNNPLLIGEAGVGKTAIVEGLAYELVHKDPKVTELANKRIVELSINSLVAGTKYRGELEERVERMIAEVKASPDIIVFIDEIHTILGGGSDSISNIANALKPALERGEFHCIGATTIGEYRRYIEKDSALRRRFETILVEEPNIDDCIKILEGIIGDIEVHHNTHISKFAIEAAVRLSHRYIQDEKLPAKAIKLLEQAAAYVRLPSFYGDPEASQEDVQPLFTEVNEDLIRYLLGKKTGIPLERLEGDELKRIKGIEEDLKAQIIGQDETVHAVSQVIKRSRAGLRDTQRPVGVFLFVGPTGVGKTELARALAGFLFNDREAIIRLDMSEYMEKHQVSRLIGAPPGYIGYDEEGQLTGKLRLKPFSVVLMDEIEKAHEEVRNIFLQLFDEGRLTDSRGNTINGREAIFIMTSNVGSDLYLQDSAGFPTKERFSPEWLKEKRNAITKAIHEKFKPEFLNRIDQVIHFNPLTPPDVTQIFQLQFQSFIKRLEESHHIFLIITSEAIGYVCKEGYDPLNGVRPLKRAIDRLIIEPLTDMILEGKVKANERIIINATGLQLTFEKEKKEGDVS